MGFLQEYLAHPTAASSIIILAVTIAFGLALGALKIRRVGLGIGGVLFAGLLVGHAGAHLDAHTLDFARELGLVLFVFTIGLQVGPGFLSSLRSAGLRLNILAVIIVLGGLLTCFAGALIFKIDIGAAAGVFAGATTNTPALAAAQQTFEDALAKASVGNPTAVSAAAPNTPGLGYAVSYPFGVIGIILSIAFARFLLMRWPPEPRRSIEPEVAEAPAAYNIRVTNANLDGMRLSEVPGFVNSPVVVSRINHGHGVEPVSDDTVLRLGDTLLAVGLADDVERFRIVVGNIAFDDLRDADSPIITRRAIVTEKSVVGRPLGQLTFLHGQSVQVPRISRGDVQFTPSPSVELHYGDRVMLVGNSRAVETAAIALGDDPRKLDSPQLIPVMLGMAAGIAVGLTPIPVPGLPVPLKLGLAGGPLVVAILMSRIRRIGPLVCYMSRGANLMLREFGIVLFLACVGLKAGPSFFATLLSPAGVSWMILGAAVTLLPLVLGFIIGRYWLRVDPDTMSGLLAGSMTDPPALAFSSTLTTSEKPFIAYATVYPLVMLLRVLLAQILVLMLLTATK